jgi:hypothetical protein
MAAVYKVPNMQLIADNIIHLATSKEDEAAAAAAAVVHHSVVVADLSEVYLKILRRNKFLIQYI